MSNARKTAASSAIRTIDVIRRKRDGQEMSPAELTHLVDGYTRGEIPDYQVSAWLMAALIRGLTRAETAALTDAMLRSSEVLDLSPYAGAKVGKHSTGGVGDKTSLIVAPVAAAGGLVVPMISGRGLGHTGGTLDKLESIRGLRVDLSLVHFCEVLGACGCSMIGQTVEFAPADRKFYSLRDATGTVESPYLICASIMSKKLAEGLDALVLDVKTGSGAFMKTEKDAIFLAELMVEAGQRVGRRTVALITDMDQPLGLKIGNALEVEECLDVLHGGGPADLRELCLELAAWMFYLGGRARTIPEGKELADRMLRSGLALEKFRQMVELQGGDPAAIDNHAGLPQATATLDVPSPTSGYVSAIQCENLGTASAILGGGREKKEDSIDPAVGISLHKKLGDRVAAGETLCTLHYNSETRAARARELVESSYQFAPTPPSLPPLVQGVIGSPRR